MNAGTARRGALSSITKRTGRGSGLPRTHTRGGLIGSGTPPARGALRGRGGGVAGPSRMMQSRGGRGRAVPKAGRIVRATWRTPPPPLARGGSTSSLPRSMRVPSSSSSFARYAGDPDGRSPKSLPLGRPPPSRAAGGLVDLTHPEEGLRVPRPSLTGLPKAGRVFTADSTAKALHRRSLPPPLPPGRPITSTDRPPTDPSPIKRRLVERAPRRTEKHPFPTERQPRPIEGACDPSQRSRPPPTRPLPKPDVPKEGAGGILERMRGLQARLNTLASANAGSSTSTQRPADHSGDLQDRRGRKRRLEECEPAAPQTSSSARAPTGEVMESTSDETGGDLPQLSRE
ncbi:hypothetical protein FOZ63_013049, partial [Perkinsus olseni]